MGRPLSKRFFGELNYGTTGTVTSGDAGLAGQTVASVTVGTAGTYTTAPTLSFPVPLEIGEGAVRATGTPVFTVVSAVVTAGGSGYANTATQFTVTSGGGTATISITPSGGALTGTVTIVSGGTFTALPGAAVAVVGGTGTGGTVTLTFGLSGATITNAGDGYLTTTTPATAITAATAGASLTLGTITVAANGVLSFGTAQSAGTFWVGQVLVASGSDSTLANGNYIVTATNGTSTVTLATLTSATGLPTTVATTTAGTATTLALATAGTVTVASANGLVGNGQVFTITGSGAASAGYAAGAYYIVAVNEATNQISLASSYANFFTTTVVSTTTTASITSTTGVGSQNLVIQVSSGSGAMSAVLATASGTQGTYGTSGEFGPAILANAWIPTGVKGYEASDITRQKGSRRYLVETPDGNGVCLLTATLPLTAGYMTIGATDSAGNTYLVTKLTRHNVTLTQNVLASGQTWQFATGAVAQWTTGTASVNVSVTIDNG